MSVMRSMLTIQISGEVKQNMKRLQSRFLRLGGLFRLMMMYIERSVQWGKTNKKMPNVRKIGLLHSKLIVNKNDTKITTVDPKIAQVKFF